MVVCCFKSSYSCWWGRECIEVDGVDKSDCYVCSRQTNSQDGRLMLQGDSFLLLGIVPDDHLRLRPTWVLAASNQSKIVVVTEHFGYTCPWVSSGRWGVDHFDNTDACIEKSRDLKGTRIAVEDAEASVRADAEA